jgi:hypothetical protein
MNYYQGNSLILKFYCLPHLDRTLIAISISLVSCYDSRFSNCDDFNCSEGRHPATSRAKKMLPLCHVMIEGFAHWLSFRGQTFLRSTFCCPFRVELTEHKNVATNIEKLLVNLP